MSFPSVEEPSSALSACSPSPQALARRAPQWKWNPYTDAPLPALLTSGILAEEAMSIPTLVDMYEQQVTALVNSHEDILFLKDKVQEAINERVSAEKPANSIAGRNDEEVPVQIAEENSELHLLKQGLDIRLRQFAEDCQSASKLEWILRRKLSATEDMLQLPMQTVKPSQVQPTCEALKKIKDQDRLIKLLQHVLDQNLYHNYVYAEGLRRMRKECFSDELHCWEAMQGDSAWFEGKEIRYEGKDSSHFVSSWMQLIRTHPSPVTVPPPPQADPQSLCFISRMREIKQLASAVAKGGHTLYSKFHRQRDLKQLQDQLSQLRKVLGGAAAAASGIEKMILKDLTTHVDEPVSDTSRAVDQRRGETAGAEAAAADGRTSDSERLTKALGSRKFEGRERARAASYAEGSTRAERNGKGEALLGRPRVSSKSPLRQRSFITPVSGGEALSKIPSATLPSARRSLTSVVEIENEKAKAAAASREGVLENRKHSYSPSRASPPRLLRGASRTLRSPRHSFQEEVRRSQSGTGETGQKRPEDFLPYVRTGTGISQGHEDREEARIGSVSSMSLNATISRRGSRTVPSPQRTISRGSLTLCSPREHQARMISTPLSRAMSSAFLGG